MGYIIGNVGEAAVASKWYALEKYLDKMERYLQKAEKEFNTEASKRWHQLKNLPPEQSLDLIEDIIEEDSHHSKEFPRILRNSFLISAVSLLEYEMVMICRRLKGKQQIPITLSDLRGNLLKRVKLYLKLAGLDPLWDSKTWSELKNYFTVRHCIVHKRGLIQGYKDEKELRLYITRKKIISQDKEEIALTEEFCKDVINTMRNFMNEVWEKAYKLRVRVKTK